MAPNDPRLHSDEFEEIPQGAKSKRGFHIVANKYPWLEYFEPDREVSIFCEFMGRRKGLIVYARDMRARSVVNPEDRIRILANITGGLEFLGWEVEVTGLESKL